jgi:glycosyltransferase involved in cell wall biosynthesis
MDNNIKMSESSKVILTIGIPVYNGARFIGDALNSIFIPQGYENKVEILVSDNCSTDNIEELLGHYKNVKYYKNSQNLGYDKNVHNIFLNARGIFVWTLAADDIICGSEAIVEVLNIIENEQEIGIINVGGCPILKSNYTIYENEKFLEVSNFNSGAVSSNIIRKNAWLASNPSDFFGTGWIHFGVVLKIIPDFKSVISQKQLIAESPATINLLKSWDTNGNGLNLVLKLVDIFNEMESFGYSKSFKKRAKMIIKKDYPKAIIKAKANGLVVTRKLIYDFIKLYKEYLTFWVIDLPILFLPNIVCKFIYKNRNRFTIKQEVSKLRI